MGKIMSFAIEPELQDRLRAYAKRKGISNSQCVRELIDRFIIDDDTIIPVVLKIPVELKGDKEQLAVWLESRKNAILEKLS
jgi:predicted DNA-binding protein